MHLFNRDEVERKREEYPRRDPPSEEQVSKHDRYAIDRKRSDDPNRRAAEINVLRFPPKRGVRGAVLQSPFQASAEEICGTRIQTSWPTGALFQNLRASAAAQWERGYPAQTQASHHTKLPSTRLPA